MYWRISRSHDRQEKRPFSLFHGGMMRQIALEYRYHTVRDTLPGVFCGVGFWIHAYVLQMLDQEGMLECLPEQYLPDLVVE